MKTVWHKISLQSRPGPSYEDLTSQVLSLLGGVEHGYVHIFSRHTTTALLLQRADTGVLDDLSRQVGKLAPQSDYYQHDDMSIRVENEPNPNELNGHAHCQGLALRCSLQIPIFEGKLQLGEHQRILFMELDQGRAREVTVQIVSVPVAAARH